MRKLFLMVAGLMISSPVLAACLQAPIPGTIITSNFGMRFHPVHHEWRPHNGMDLRAAMMTKVYAAGDGRVGFSGWIGGGGNAVYINGADGVMTRYLHLSKPLVRPGESISAGQLVGLSGGIPHGRDGASTAPHLHFEARPAPGSGPVDPRTLMCAAMAEKPGAGPDKDAVSAGGTIADNAGASSGIPDSAPNMAGWAGMAEQEIMRAEAGRRFLNPDWHMQVSNCTGDALLAGTGNIHLSHTGKLRTADCQMFLLRELAEIKSLKQWIAYRKHEVRERVEIILSSMAAEEAKRNSTAHESAQRKAAAHAGGKGRAM